MDSDITPILLLLDEIINSLELSAGTLVGIHTAGNTDMVALENNLGEEMR